MAFAVLAHGNLDHLARLVARLSECPTDTVVVHLDRRMSEKSLRPFKEKFSNSSNVLYAHSRRCYWGGWSLVDASFRCIDRLADSVRPFKYLSLLSGTDYPIKAIDSFRGYLASNNGTEFIEAHHIAWEDFIQRGFTTGRYEYVFPFARDALHPLIFSCWQAVLETLDIRRILPPWVLPYGGSQWWTLSVDAVDYLRLATTKKRIKAVFRWAFVPDEHAFQAALMASPFRSQVAHDNLRYILHSPAGGPEWLAPADMALALNSDKFFARKISPEHSMAITTHVDSVIQKRGREITVGCFAPLKRTLECPQAGSLRRFLAKAYAKISRRKSQARTALSIAELPLRDFGSRIVIVATELAEQAEKLAQIRQSSNRTACIRFDEVLREERAETWPVGDGAYFVVVHGIEDVLSMGRMISKICGPTEIYLDICIADSRQNKNKMIDDILQTGFMFDGSMRDRRFLRFVERPQKRSMIGIPWI